VGNAGAPHHLAQDRNHCGEKETMTDLQLIHHEEQVDALRRDFMDKWCKNHPGSEPDSKESIQSMIEQWKAFRAEMNKPL
jgi:hypothetical protein